MSTGQSFTPGSTVEVQGGAIFGKGYEGSWHCGTLLLDSTSSRQGHQPRYDVELNERVPHSTQPQVARKILSEHIRPQPASAALSWSELRPGLLVEHRLPEVRTCWWLALVVSIQGGKAVMAHPISSKGHSYHADPSHSFRATAHWDVASSSWLSIWMGPFADHYQECMYHSFSKLHPRKKAAERRSMMPDVHELTATSAADIPYTYTDIGPGTPRVQGTASNGAAVPNTPRTPRSSRCLKVIESPARTPRGKSGATAGRLDAVQRAVRKGSPAPETPRRRKAAAKSRKGAGKKVAGTGQKVTLPVSVHTCLPAHMHAAYDSRGPCTPRRSRITDADVLGDATLLVGNAASSPASAKVPLLPIGGAPVSTAAGDNSMVALSPRVLEDLHDHARDGLQMPAAVSVCQSWQSNDLLAVYNKEDAKKLRKRALEAACKGEQLSDPAGGSWDLGDLGDVAGDWAPTIGSMNLSFVKVQEARKTRHEVECAAMQLLSLKCAQT